MSHKETVQRIHDDLIDIFEKVDKYFDLPSELRQFQADAQEWSIDEILEHITLTNHFLMITLKQSLAKVLRRAKKQEIPKDDSRLDRIMQISDPDAFGWIRPEHMEPTRLVSSQDIRKKMFKQKNECIEVLSQIKNGEGSLHRVRMSVQELGKLNMYEWLYFLVQHAKRHCVEIERIREIYTEQSS